MSAHHSDRPRRASTLKECPTATVAEFVCRCLLDCGVRHVFGGHGGSVVPLINAIIKTNEGGAAGLKWVYCRTEVNAAMCAAAYGKLRSALGVCVGTSGPGASHLVSGAIDAQLDRVPMLVLTVGACCTEMSYCTPSAVIFAPFSFFPFFRA